MVANHIQRPHSILQATVPAHICNFTIHKPNKGLERQHVLKHPRTCVSLLLQVVS